MGAVGRQRYSKSFFRLVIACGLLVCLAAVANLQAAALDLRLLILTAATVIVSSYASIKIPRINLNTSIADTFTFLALLLYGAEVAVLLAAVEGLSSGVRISKTPRIIAFNAAATACSTFITARVLGLMFGPTTSLLSEGFLTVAGALTAMALVQYFANTGVVALGISFKDNRPVWQTWIKHCHWASVSYLVGAAAAGAIAVVSGRAGIYAIAVAIPVIFVLYLTYSKYLEELKTSARQAELAEHARAEAERARAEAAERHIADQQRHIAELERVKQQLEESREHFRHAAFHDELTGLPNRALLLDHVKLTIERAKTRATHLYSVLFLDLDRFKNINDSLGHAAGNQLLIEISRRLQRCLQPTDTVARLGGDEFAILLDDLASNEEAVRAAERIQAELARPLYLNGQEVFTTASIGVTLCSAHYDEPEKILRDADTAMYHAKEKGKARYELFDAAMHANVVAKLQLENDLRRAVENQEFCVYYQPIMALADGRVTGFEALVRWRHPERGVVGPAEFIGLAEETGLINDIGLWVLRESCRQSHEWHQQNLSLWPLTVSVNLSGKQFAHADLIGHVEKVLCETGIESSMLKLELTESAVMENAEAAARMLARLRELGIQLSIDDFGTGYSSLSYLHRFPIDTLKIDRSFVNQIGHVDEKVEIVKTVVTLATNLGMAVVAEGVETNEQLAQLKQLKCEYAQGYLFSKPLAPESVPAFVQENQSICQSAPPALLPVKTASAQPAYC